ncbi:MAG: hypothetical protein EHM58_08120 [Ignavibacteriae bacterium]|nr:MAG: hypothetical protein EHM58_08120 [Ignavibacteriota bacterium]
MKYLILLLTFLILLPFSSCEDNLNSPAVNPDIKANSKVMVELFSSISCVKCVQASIYCDNISFLKGITANDSNVVIINYHPSFFSSDPLYQFNKQLNIERQNIYGIFFIPSGFVDGSNLPSPFSSSEWTNQINSELSKTKDIKISLQNSVDTINRTGSLVIQITHLNNVDNYGIGDLRLFIIVTEDDLFVNAPNGKNYYNNVARQMINHPGGEQVQIQTGQTTITKNYSVIHGIVIQNSVIVVFIQEFDSNKIVTSEKIKIH